MLLPAGAAFAATINVDSGCTLNDAIASANFDGSLQNSDCEDGSGADTIELSANVTLTAHMIGIGGGITINGNGYTISGADTYKCISVETDGTNLTLNNVVLSNCRRAGNGGAIIFSIEPSGDDGVGGSLTINNSVIRNSQATGSSSQGGGIYTYSSRSSKPVTVSINGSAIHGNTSSSFGGGITFRLGTTATITNSTIYGNSATVGGGGGIYFSGNANSLTLNHVTITGNTGASGSIQGGGLRFNEGTLVMRNSIIAGNTNGNCTVLTNGVTFTTKTNNIIGGSSTSNCTTISSGGTAVTDAGLAASASGSPPYFDLTGTSKAIDAAGDCTSITTTDQRGKTRPIGSACDIGAVEYDPPPATATPTATATATATATPRPGQPTSPPARVPVRVVDPPGIEPREEPTEEWCPPTFTPTPTATRTPPPPTCLTLPSHISVRNITHSTQCQQVDAAGIGNAAVLSLGFRDGVDVWGWVLPNMQICFEGSSGSFRFLDAATAPRAVSELPAVGIGNMICTTINRAGTVAWVNGPPAPAPSAIPTVPQRLSGCMVLTQYALNFRASPGGEVINVVPHNVRLTALEKAPGWYKVDYHGAQGWISAQYVAPSGTCG